MLKGIIFDYGGTLDSNGVHWAHVIWQGYQSVEFPITEDYFRQAYVYAERALACTPYIQAHHDFLDLLRIKIEIQFNFILEQQLASAPFNSNLSEAIARFCDDYARRCIARTRPILRALQQRYTLVLVSNFYGNIASVLTAYGLSEFFPEIVESAVVGIRKPDPRIFALGLQRLGLPAEQVVVIGDSYNKDILPANSLGCSTIWLKGKGWKSDENPVPASQRVITDFQELASILFY